jgi:RNA polymerase sigma-70 factor, ECF subfamily
MITAKDSGSWETVAAKLRDYVGRRVRNPADRDDIVQDALVRVLDGLPGLRTPEALGPWIYRIARNAVVDHWRRSGNADEPLPEDWDRVEEEAESAVVEEVATYMRALLGLLPPADRAVLDLTELEGLSQKDAASRLGLSLAATKSKVRRGRLKLRAALEHYCRLEVSARGELIGCEPKPGSACRRCTCGEPLPLSSTG